MMNHVIHFTLLIALIGVLGDFAGKSKKEQEEKDFEALEKKWKRCCENNVCVNNTCYSIAWRTGSWTTVRDRCVADREDNLWPYTIDLLRVQDETDIEKLWDLFANAEGVTKQNGSILPSVVWTRGTSCPRKREHKGIIVSNRWTTNERFPYWLEVKMLGTIFENISLQKDCKFLAISPAKEKTDVKYSFRSEFEQHAAICEFMLPKYINWKNFTYSRNTESTDNPTRITRTKETPVATDPKSQNITERSDFEALKKKWKRCCENNVCVNSTCYSIAWRTGAWTTVRDRCAADRENNLWPYTIDLFRVNDETDIEELWDLFANAVGVTKQHVLPSVVWTRGTSCPKKREPEGIIVSNRWTTNERFPRWLEIKTRGTVFEDISYQKDCKFLAISPAKEKTEVKYSFRSEFEQHAAICEFMFPKYINWENFTESTITQSTSKNSAKPTIGGSTEFTDETSRKSTFESSTEQNRESTKSTLESSTEQNIDSTTSLRQSSTKETITLTESTLKVSTESPISTSTKRCTQYCKGKTESGITWPDTKAGEWANVSCPEGLTGYAQWLCDSDTLKFHSSGPDFLNCKQDWIVKLEKEVEEEEGDAVDISYKLANKTKFENLSHGDLPAVINLSVKIFDLYLKKIPFDKPKIQDGANETFLEYTFSQSMLETLSNVFKNKFRNAWNQLSRHHQEELAVKILKLTPAIGKHISCASKPTANQLQFTVVTPNIKMQTFALWTDDQRNSETLEFPQSLNASTIGTSIIIPSNLSLKHFNPPCEDYSTAVGIVYHNINGILDEYLNESSNRLITPVLSFSFDNSTDSRPLTEGKLINLVFKHDSSVPHYGFIQSTPKCVFWNYSKGQIGMWDDSGCKMTFSSLSYTKCECDHLTNFAVLMDINEVMRDDNEKLKLLTYACCGASSIALFATILFFAIMRSLRTKRNTITGHLSFCLLMMNLIILFGFDKTEYELYCKIIAGVLQFFVLSAFCWMLGEGFHLYRIVSAVFTSTSTSLKRYYLFCYGVPIVIVGISAAIRYEDYGGPYFCWLSPVNGLIWSFVGPQLVIIGINIIIFVVTIRSAAGLSIRTDQSFARKFKGFFVGSVSVLSVLGVTWSVGLFYSERILFGASYIFIILNGCQGILIFFFHVLMNDKLKGVIFRKNRKASRLTLSTSPLSNSGTKRQTPLQPNTLNNVSTCPNNYSIDKQSSSVSQENRVSLISTISNNSGTSDDHGYYSAGYEEPPHYSTISRYNRIPTTQKEINADQASSSLKPIDEHSSNSLSHTYLKRVDSTSSYYSCEEFPSETLQHDNEYEYVTVNNTRKYVGACVSKDYEDPNDIQAPCPKYAVSSINCYDHDEDINTNGVGHDKKTYKDPIHF